MDVKGWIFLLVLVLSMCALSFWGGRCSAPKSAYVEAPMPDPRIDPPDTVRMVRWRKTVLPDSSWREKYDSLLASIGGQDSMAWYLVPWSENHRWRIERDGMLAAGDLGLYVDPIRKEATPTQTLDTLRLPPPVIRTETVETISIPWLIGAVAVGVAAGVWAGSR